MFRKKNKNTQDEPPKEPELAEAFAAGCRELRDYHNFGGNLALIHADIRDMKDVEVADELEGKKNKTDIKPILIYGGFAIIMIVIAATIFMQYQDTAGWMQKYATCSGELTALKTANAPGIRQTIPDERLQQSNANITEGAGNETT